MQEEVEQRTVILMENCAKLTERELRQALSKLLEEYGKQRQERRTPSGKMSVRQLAAQNRGMQSIEVTENNIGSFNRVARKYGIDFAPFKVKGENRYLVFFKAGDTDAMTAAFREYTEKQMNRDHRPSVREKLDQMKSMIRTAAVDRTRKTERER